MRKGSCDLRTPYRLQLHIDSIYIYTVQASAVARCVGALRVAVTLYKKMAVYSITTNDKATQSVYAYTQHCTAYIRYIYIEISLLSILA